MAKITIVIEDNEQEGATPAITFDPPLEAGITASSTIAQKIGMFTAIFLKELSEVAGVDDDE